jgi:hypothetical protein
VRACPKTVRKRAGILRTVQREPADPINHQVLAEVYRRAGKTDFAANEDQQYKELSATGKKKSQ